MKLKYNVEKYVLAVMFDTLVKEGKFTDAVQFFNQGSRKKRKQRHKGFLFLGRETEVSRKGDISWLGPPSVIYVFLLSLDFSRMIST